MSDLADPLHSQYTVIHTKWLKILGPVWLMRWIVTLDILVVRLMMVGCIDITMFWWHHQTSTSWCIWSLRHDVGHNRTTEAARVGENKCYCCVKFGLKIPNHLGKMSENFPGGGKFLLTLSICHFCNHFCYNSTKTCQFCWKLVSFVGYFRYANFKLLKQVTCWFYVTVLILLIY